MCLLICVLITFAQPQPKKIRIVASGDTLVHWRVKKTAMTKNTVNEKGVSTNHGGFDWILEDVSPVFQAADIAFVNLETPTDPQMHTKIHGEIFNAPLVFLDALAHAGINVVSFANNHSFDQGPEGLVRTITELEHRSIIPLGAGADCATAYALRTKTVHGVRVGFLALTDLLNINQNMTDSDPCVALPGPLCTQDCVPDRDALWFHIDEPALLASLNKAKSQVDILILSFHWGTEYLDTPLTLYSTLAPKLMEAGVDVLLGHHAHTLQPVVRYIKENQSEGIIAYSLGNLFSDMSRKYGRYPEGTARGKTRDGVLLSLEAEIRFSDLGESVITFPKLELIPLWTENSNDAQLPNIRVRRHSTIIREDPERKSFVEKRRKGMPFSTLEP